MGCACSKAWLIAKHGGLARRSTTHERQAWVRRAGAAYPKVGAVQHPVFMCGVTCMFASRSKTQPYLVKTKQAINCFICEWQNRDCCYCCDCDDYCGALGNYVVVAAVVFWLPSVNSCCQSIVSVCCARHEFQVLHFKCCKGFHLCTWRPRPFPSLAPSIIPGRSNIWILAPR